MNTRITRAISISGFIAIAVSHLASCSSRSTDCHWNENCESSAGGQGTAGDSNGGAQFGGNASGGSSHSGGSTTSTVTTATTCSGLPKDACSIDETFGVFVSPLGNDASAGTETAPVASLRKALEMAATPRNGKKRSVFVCASAGEFKLTETLLIDASVDGVSLYGGFDCSDETSWILPATPTPSRIASASPVAVKLLRIGSEIHVENLSITAADADASTAPGSSSIAMLIAESPNVQLAKVDLIAGKGATGKAGTSYADLAPMVGTSGVDGLKACLTGVGAPQTQIQCEGAPAPSVGGRGGDGATLTSTTADKPGFNGENGLVAPDPNPDGKGAGGFGEVTEMCKAGTDGIAGANGASAEGGKGTGDLTQDGYVGVDGKPGNAGKPGQGGGGGGGAKAPKACTTAASTTTPTHGASGGSGGTGGCGGKGGGAGQGGGASFALAIVNSGVSLKDCHLTANRAGNGGMGGPAQGGGAGGLGGRGADGYGSSSLPSCDGGKGGRGGAGSPGGGGAGGPSAAIAWVGTAATVSSSVLKFSSEAAAGGTDGSGSTVAAGSQGNTAEQLQL
ncbi:MAG: hypothetical protein QM784_14220 [Polyangiaceae bacterium]